MTPTKSMAAKSILAMSVAAAISSQAIAQDEGESRQSTRDLVLEQIIVTAQKREETLAETPVAVTAATGDKLNALGINTLQDIANLAPSMSYQEVAGGGEGNRIYLRGIGRETSVTGTDPGVGVYNNGFYTSESAVMAASVDRIERIEVLRGPQGTLYGRNTTGGALNLVAKKPGEESEAVARVNAGSYGRKQVELTYSAPLTDTFGVLVHMTDSSRDSYYTNTSGPQPIGIDNRYVEAQFDWDLSDSINWHFRYFTAESSDETLGMVHLSPYLNGPTAPSKLGSLVINPELFAPNMAPPSLDDPFMISSDMAGFVDVDDSNNYQSTFSIDLDAMTIRVLNGYSEYTWYGEKDNDGTASPVSLVEAIGQKEDSTQHEIQFISNGDGAISWVGGLFYYENNLDQPYWLLDRNNPYLVNALDAATYAPVANPEGEYYYQSGTLEAKSTAVYGQVDWALNDALTINVGLRYSEDEKSGTEQQRITYDSGLCYDSAEQLVPYFLLFANPYGDTCADLGVPGVPPRAGLRTSDASASHSESWDALNFKLGATYETDSAMMYASLTSGYKPGGFRLGGMQDNPATAENESVVENEEVMAYEIGYKGALSESFIVAAAAYYYDYTDMQVELGIIDPNTGLVQNLLANAPDVSIYGFEVESTWAATDKLTMFANYSYTTSQFEDDFIVSDNKDDSIRNVKGNELNRTPNSKFSLSGIHVEPLSNGSELVLSANYTWVDDQYFTVFNDDIETIKSYDVVNARAAWVSASGNLEVGVYGKNLANDVNYAYGYEISEAADGNRAYGRPSDPRTFGAELVVRF